MALQSNAHLRGFSQSAFFFSPSFKFVGAFAKFRKATINCDISVCLSVCMSVRMEQLGSHWTAFHGILNFSFFFRKSVDKIQVSLKSDKINEYLTWRAIYIFDHISLSSSCWRLFPDTISRENQNTHFTVSNVFSKIVPFLNNVGKFCTAGQATDDSIIRRMRIACGIPKATNTVSEYVTHCFSTETVFARTHLNVTLYAHCLPY
jgi:hypothetical protein